MNILIKLQSIDKRILYIVVALVVSLPLILRPSAHPSLVVSEVQNAYNTLDSVPKGKVVIIDTTWGPGTAAENEPQTKAIMRHLFQKNIPFVVLSWDQAGNDQTYNDAESVAKEITKEGKYGEKRYGKDWVHLGYKYPDTSVMRTTLLGMQKNFLSTMGKDKMGTPLTKLEVTKHLKNSKNVGAVVELTATSTIELWISYFNGPSKVPLIYCPTAVMAAEAYQYVDAGQVKGLLNGVIGAAQYETLVGLGNKPTEASITTLALSAVIVYIIVLIILGNLGYFAKRRESRNQGGA